MEKLEVRVGVPPELSEGPSPVWGLRPKDRQELLLQFTVRERIALVVMAQCIQTFERECVTGLPAELLLQGWKDITGLNWGETPWDA